MMSATVPSAPTRQVLSVEPLTSHAFSPFGQVIETQSAAQHFVINQGFCERFNDLAHVDVAHQGGRTIISIFRTQPRVLPLQLTLLERHPLGSQAFVALSPVPFLVVVAPGNEAPRMSAVRCFLAAPGQGVNYARATWHHPLIALNQASDFLVVDRAGAANDQNLEEHLLDATPWWIDTLTPG